MTEKFDLTAEPREITGKKVSQLRRKGITPATLYGPGTPSTSIQLDTHDLELLLRDVGDEAITLSVGKNTHNVVVKELQRHPVTGVVAHVDFYQPAK